MGDWERVLYYQCDIMLDMFEVVQIHLGEVVRKATTQARRGRQVPKGNC